VLWSSFPSRVSSCFILLLPLVIYVSKPFDTFSLLVSI
jgi:hypothetical protein